jgi:hypothetical protein
MKKLIFPLTVVLIFYLGTLAYERAETNAINQYKAENDRLKYDLVATTKALGQVAIENANKQEEQKKILKVLFPAGIEQIEKVFAPPAPPAPAPVQPEKKEGDK